MKNFKPMIDANKGSDSHLRFVNAKKAFEFLQIRMSKQLGGMQYFADPNKVA